MPRKRKTPEALCRSKVGGTKGVLGGALKEERRTWDGQHGERKVKKRVAMYVQTKCSNRVSKTLEIVPSKAKTSRGRQGVVDLRGKRMARIAGKNA